MDTLSKTTTKADDTITDTLRRVRLATGRGDSASPRDISFLLARLDALEIGLAGTRDFIASQPEDIFGYDEEGDPEVGTRSWPVRDYELWCIDQVLKNGLTLNGRRHTDRREAQFDAIASKQEELVINFSAELAASRDRGFSIDPVRLLEMASELYHAEMDDAREDVYPDEEKREALRTLDRIMVGLNILPEGTWKYRPTNHDDWGTIRNLNTDGETIGFIARARSGKFETEDEAALTMHRELGTDPYAPVGRHIENCNPNAIRQILDLVRHLENEVRRLSKLDREYARVESWIIMNTEYDGKSKVTDCGDRLIRHLQGLKRRVEYAEKRSFS